MLNISLPVHTMRYCALPMPCVSLLCPCVSVPDNASASLALRYSAPALVRYTFLCLCNSMRCIALCCYAFAIQCKLYLSLAMQPIRCLRLTFPNNASAFHHHALPMQCNAQLSLSNSSPHRALAALRFALAKDSLVPFRVRVPRKNLVQLDPRI